MTRRQRDRERRARNRWRRAMRWSLNFEGRFSSAEQRVSRTNAARRAAKLGGRWMVVSWSDGLACAIAWDAPP
jgi:hypothetical protein